MVATLALSVLLTFVPDASHFHGVLLNANDAPQNVSLAVPGFRGVEMSPEKAEFFSTHFATQMTKLGVKVTTAQDIQALVSMQRQKELVGCGDKGSDKCMTEIANALGADGIVVGSIANLSGSLALNLKVIDAVDGRTLAIYDADAPNDKAALDMLTVAAKDIQAQLRHAHTASMQTGEQTAQKGPASIRFERRPTAWRAWGKSVTIVGTVMLGVGVVGLLLTRVPAVGLVFGTIGLISLIAAPVVILVGVVMYFSGSEEMVPVRTALLPDDRKLQTPMFVAARF